VTLQFQHFDGLVHQVHAAQGMLKSGVNRRRIDIMSQPQLFDPSQSLKPGMFNDLKYKVVAYGYKTINRVIDDLSFD